MYNGSVFSRLGNTGWAAIVCTEQQPSLHALDTSDDEKWVYKQRTSALRRNISLRDWEQTCLILYPQPAPRQDLPCLRGRRRGCNQSFRIFTTTQAVVSIWVLHSWLCCPLPVNPPRTNTNHLLSFSSCPPLPHTHTRRPSCSLAKEKGNFSNRNTQILFNKIL